MQVLTEQKSRRKFLEALGGAGVLGVSKALFPAWMPRLAFRFDQGAPGDVLVAVFLRGGMDGLNVVVPYAEGGLYYDRRPTIAIPAPGDGDDAALDLDGRFGLHPALRPLKDIYDAGTLAVIHAAGSPDPSRSHFDAMEFMERGTPGAKNTPTGWISRHLQSAAWQNTSPFRAVGMGAMVQSSLQGPVSALALRSIVDFHLGGREDMLEAIQRTLSGLYSIDAPQDLLRTQARETFAVLDIMSRLTATEYTPDAGAEYPDTEFGLGLKQVAQLIKAGVGLEVACVDLGGWDTHEDQGGAEGWQAGLLSELGAGLAALNADLGDAMNNVCVVTMSEFGRRVDENASRGTDHGHGNAMFVMGGGVSGGLYADWPGLADEALDDGDLAITTDYRDVLSEILVARVLNPALDQVFPGYTYAPRGILRAR
ncbi:MAG: DUF1501 domain-containing protein [Anaerolineae bacterium]|nr:DUF1501 domain-containing protein [Anaerolineae bacterium]